VEHIAIDLGAIQSQICVRSIDGAIVLEQRIATSALPRWLERRPKSRVIVETSAESFFIADAARTIGHEVRVVAASLAPSLGVGARRTKRDRNDARTLSEVSCRIDLPSVHVPTKESRDRKTMCGMRESLIASRTALINAVRGWLRQTIRRVRRGTPNTFPARVRELGPREPWIERHLETIECLNKQIQDASDELESVAKEDSLCQRLMTVPGVGPVTSVRFAAALDDVTRFPTAHMVESYLGLVPGEDSSGTREQRLSITKAGPPALRRTLVQAAWCTRRCRRRDPMVDWSLEVEKRRGSRIAIVALARKLAGIMYAIWRDGSTYLPQRTARVH
jgi:transposase